VLYQGCSSFSGTIPSGISHYQKIILTGSKRISHGKIIRRVTASSEHIFFGDDISISIEVTTTESIAIGINVQINNERGELVFLLSTNPHDGIKLPNSGEFQLILDLPSLTLAPGNYSIDVAATEPTVRILETIEGACTLSVFAKKVGGQWAYEKRFGQLFPAHKWTISQC
jgi:hypothetical protein